MLQLRNILGDIRAESDRHMLDVAFIETPEYKGVVETQDFNFVVGRRGTGKSALKYSASKYLREKRDHWVFDIENTGYGMLSIQSFLSEFEAEYRQLNYIMNITSRVAICFEIIGAINSYYKKKKLFFEKDIADIYKQYSAIIGANFYTKCVKILQSISGNIINPLYIPSAIADQYCIADLERISEDSLRQINKKAVFLFDNLDEGWTPKPLETSIVGGLAHAATHFKDHQSPIHIYIFSRDNMFRAIASLDTDFTRNIEGAVVRLKWDDSSLFHLVAERIRQSFDLNVENNVKAWNRVAKNDISGRPGFKICTNKTLYRPRDILSLLNQSFILAAKDNRNEIIYNDIELAAKEISTLRLNDLSNEYSDVFPSLALLIDGFKNSFTPCLHAEAIPKFQDILDSEGLNPTATRDFGIFSSAEDCFLALYSIGFIGIDTECNGQITFCHDGASASSIDTIVSSTKIWVHPCYWDALAIKNTEAIDITSSIYDDYSSDSHKLELVDLRIKQLGAVITDIGRIPMGPSGAAEYEDWILRAVKILFHDSIENPQLHPNGSAISRRDVVGTITTAKGFWSRVNKDYKCRQIIFEAKNYEELKHEDIRQVLDYMSDNYGDFCILVPRRKTESPTKAEIGWIRDAWVRHKKMVFILPNSLLIQCISKQRSKNRYDYTEKALSRRLDTFERNYISIRHS